MAQIAINAGWLLSANAIAALLGLATTAISARALDAHGFGILAMIFVFQQSVARLVTFQVWQTLVRFGSIALAENDSQGFMQVLKCCFSVDLCSSLVGFFVGVFCSFFVPGLLGWPEDIGYQLRLVSISFLFMFEGTATGILRIFNRFGVIGRQAVLASAMRFCGSMLAYIMDAPLDAFVWVYLVSYVAGQAYGIGSAIHMLKRRREMHFLRSPLRGLQNKFPGIWEFVLSCYLNATINWIPREADLILVSALATPEATGMYKLAKQVAHVLTMAFDPLYHAIYPELSNLWAHMRYADMQKVVVRGTLAVGMGALAFLLVFIFWGKHLITFFFGSSFLGSYSVVVAYSLGTAIAVTGFTLQPTLLAMGLAKRALGIHTVCAVIYMLVLWPLITTASVLGAGIAYIIYNALLTLCKIATLRTYSTKIKTWKQTLPIQAVPKQGGGLL